MYIQSTNVYIKITSIYIQIIPLYIKIKPNYKMKTIMYKIETMSIQYKQTNNHPTLTPDGPQNDLSRAELIKIMIYY